MHTKRNIALICILLCLFSIFFTGCGKSKEYTKQEQLNDSNATIAMWSGLPMERAKEKYFPKAKADIAVDTIAMNISNLRGKKVDAFLTARVFYDTFPNKEGLKLLGDELGGSSYGFFFANNDKGKKLRDEMNAFIEKANKTGLRDELEEIWLKEGSTGRKTGTGSEDPNAPELLYAVEYATPPFGSQDNNACVGFDVDYADCFCKEYGYRMKVVGLPFSMIIAGDVSGEYDFAGGALMLNEDIEQSKIVSNPHYTSPFVVVVRDTENGGGTFSLKKGLYNTFVVDDRWQMYVNGLASTLLIFLVAAFFGTLLGFLVFLIDMRAGKGFHKVVNTIFTVLHITPTVVLLMIFYHIIFHGINLSGMIVSCIVFTLLMTGTVFGLMSSSVSTIDKGQREAAIALGCTPTQAFFKVVLPQALRHFIPLYKGELVNLIKISSIVGYIAVQDLTKVSDIIQTRTFDAFIPLFSAAVIYILLALILIWIVNVIFRKTDPRKRGKDKILAGLDEGKEGSK